MPDDTGRHRHLDAVPPPAPGEGNGRAPRPRRDSPWKRWSRPEPEPSPEPFADEPTETRIWLERLYPPLHKACVERNPPVPMWQKAIGAVVVTLAAGAIAWAAGELLDSGTADAVHDAKIESLEASVDEVKEEVRGLRGDMQDLIGELRGR